jgi:magnesium-transporting ATPase (P-type)
VFIKNDENIPADIIVLATALENGLFYIQTSSLDGEKGLKTKM